MNRTLNLSTAASALISNADKVRVRTKDGQLQIRPTNRTELRNLPKGEMLAALRVKKQATRGTFRVTLPADMLAQAGSKMLVTPVKHGWLNLELVSMEILPNAQVASASVSEK